MDIDGTVLAGLVFSLLCLLVIGGFILMYPLTRRLGALMEQRLEDRTVGGDGDASTAARMLADRQLKDLRTGLAALESEVERLAERQKFMEGLLESGERAKERSGP
ncbi:MAG TPA: hypothetical protein VMM83_00870 [Longimicrobiales bacterium]|nr:hypothetical protein [Longimicrobiales bacterium]